MDQNDLYETQQPEDAGYGQENEHHSAPVKFMKTEEGKKYRRIAILVISIFAVCLLMVLILFRFESIHSTVTWIVNSMRSILLGLGFAYILSPFDNSLRRGLTKLFLKRRKASASKTQKAARGISVTVTFLIGVGIIVAIIVLIVPSFVESVQKLDIRDALERVQAWVNARADSDDVISVIASKVISSVNQFFTTDLANYLTSISNFIISAGYQVVMYVLDFLISLIVALYALLEKETFARHSKKMLYACFKPERANGILDVFRHGNRVFGNYLSFKIVDCMIVGVLLFVLMKIFGIPYATPIAVFCGVVNFVPYIGPFIGGIPSGLIILLVAPNKVILFIIIFVSLMVLDANILTPWMLGDRTGVSPFWIIFSLLFFRSVFGLFGDGMGVIGMIVGVPLFVVIDYFVSRAVNRRLEKKHLDDCPFDYKDVNSIDTEVVEDAGDGEVVEEIRYVKVVPEEDTITLWDQTKHAFAKLKPKKRKKKRAKAQEKDSEKESDQHSDE
ncbi:MAG: AI-2E family transporter [Clostridia bacterium]|nr:AI-2E family transporter [Clostridia bacterium]